MGCLSLLYVKTERKYCFDVCVAEILPELLRYVVFEVQRHGSMQQAASVLGWLYMLSGKHGICGCSRGWSAGCAQKIYKEGGMSALFKGNFATMVKVTPQTAIQFAVSLLQIWKPALSSGVRTDSLVHNSACWLPLCLPDVFSYRAVQVLL